MTDDAVVRTRNVPSARSRTLAVLGAVCALLVIGNVVAAVRVLGYRRDLARLRNEMSDGERNRVDLALESAANRAKAVAEQVRRQSHSDRELHLAVQLDSSRMLLERDGVVLREMPIALGKTGVVGVAPDSHRVEVVRGARAVARVVGSGETWEAPAWLFRDRGLMVPPDSARRIKGALGRAAFLFADGTPIYALPANGPLADSTYVMPGAILLRSDDLRAIAPNVAPGLTVYFYE